MGAQLFRLEGAATLAQPDALAEGLRRHLRYARLTSCLVQIGSRRQAYLTLDGCAGCTHDRCEPGCRVELLRRVLHVAFGPTARLLPVPKGLAMRPYTRLALALPRRAAVLPIERLGNWPEARLSLRWWPGAAPRASLLLAVGADGPAPAGVLRDCGWRAWDLPQRVCSALFRRWPEVLTVGAPLAGHWTAEPTLLWDSGGGGVREANVVATTSFTPTAVDAALHRSTHQHLRAILAGEDGLLEEHSTPGDDEQPGWPAGPGVGRATMRPGDLAALVAACHSLEDGLSRKRVAALLPEHHKEHAGALMVWFDAAGVLEAAPDPAQPFRRPRRLLALPDEQVAAMLSSTPLPASNDRHDRAASVV